MFKTNIYDCCFYLQCSLVIRQLGVVEASRKDGYGGTTCISRWLWTRNEGVDGWVE